MSSIVMAGTQRALISIFQVLFVIDEVQKGVILACQKYIIFTSGENPIFPVFTGCLLDTY